MVWKWYIISTRNLLGGLHILAHRNFSQCVQVYAQRIIHAEHEVQYFLLPLKSALSAWTNLNLQSFGTDHTALLSHICSVLDLVSERNFSNLDVFDANVSLSVSVVFVI